MKLIDYTFILLATFFLSLNFIFLKIGSEYFPPILFSALRFLFITPLALFFPKPQIPFRYLISIGVTIGLLQFLCLNFALNFGLGAGLVSLMMQSSILFTAVFAKVFLNETLKAINVLGIMIGILGIFILVNYQGYNFNTHGFVMAIMAVIATSIGTVIIKKVHVEEPLNLMVWTSLVPTAPLLFASYLFEDHTTVSDALTSINSWGLISLLYTSFVSTLITGTLWISLLRRHELIKLMPYSLLVPLFTSTLSACFLGEYIRGVYLLGGILIFLGIYLSQRGGE